MRVLSEAGKVRLQHWLGLYDNDDDVKLETKVYTISDKYIYLMKCGIYHKIGYGLSPKSRKEQLQIGNPYEVTVVYSLKHPKAQTIEKELHLLFKEKRTRGEWFELEESDVTRIKEFINAYD